MRPERSLVRTNSIALHSTRLQTFLRLRVASGAHCKPLFGDSDWPLCHHFGLHAIHAFPAAIIAFYSPVYDIYDAVPVCLGYYNGSLLKVPSVVTI